MKKEFLSAISTCLSLTLFCLLISSCDKFLILEPPVDQISPKLVFNNDNSATSAMTGIYSRMINTGFASGDLSSVSSVGGMSADELISYNSSYTDYYNNALLPTNAILSSSLWTGTYQFIYTTNAILEGLNSSNSLSPAVKQQIEGEAMFTRAFCYFYLTNLFGDIPMPLISDYRINAVAKRTKQQDVYLQIASDLKAAETLLGNDYITTERVRPNKWTVKAMMARLYLYTGNWADAITYSSALIDQKPLYDLQTDLNKVFLKNNSEALWQLAPGKAGLNTNEALNYLLTGTPTSVSMPKAYVDSFEDSDKRKSVWIGSINVGNKTYYFCNKYKVRSSTPATEYTVVLRLAEQYLIRAEAKIQAGQIESGVEDLNQLRNRARAEVSPTSPNPLPAIATNLSKAQALLAVEQERKNELFAEWGHRWLDLKRTNRADILLSAIKGASWQKTDVLFPIPQSERNANNAITQNEGY